MKPNSVLSILIKLSALVILAGLLTSCGSSAEDAPSQGVPQGETSVEGSTDDSRTETNTTGASVEDITFCHIHHHPQDSRGMPY